MSIATAKAPAVSQGSVGVWRIAQSAAVVSIGLYTLAFVVRSLTMVAISFPLTEGSAYYVAVARNLAAGRGLAIDAIWSYATPPLVLPRPAFELWQPLASFVAAVPMTVLGSSFAMAQFGSLFVGALIAPLTWLVARDAAHRLELTERRTWFVSVGAGAVAAIAGPFLLAAAVPDSSMTFTVLAVAACLLMPAASGGDRRAVLGLGIVLGLVYLTRFEAIWLGLTFVALLVLTRPAGASWRPAIDRIAGVAATAALVAIPWWLRNFATFGSPFPGQIADNVFLTRNEQIYAYLDRPSLSGFLSQGLPTIVANVTAAFWHDFVDVLLVPAAPVVIVGGLTLVVAAWRRRRLPAATWTSPLVMLLASGVLTFVATSVLFPVATQWGTFEHAAGPLLVGLTVAAVLGADAFVAWLVRRRHWQRENGWMAPAALIALMLPLALLQWSSAAHEAQADHRTIASLAEKLPAMLAAAGVDPAAPIITDRPIWLSDATGRPTLALSDEPVDTLLALAARFGAGSVVVVEQRGGYPDDLQRNASACFKQLSVDGAAVFAIDGGCLR